MKTRFLDKINVVSGGSAQSETKQVPAGNWHGVLLTLEGETDSGQTLDKDEIGTIVVHKPGFGDLINTEIGVWNDYMDLIGGHPAKPSGSSNTQERVNFFIPFGLPNYPNVQQVLRDGDLSIKVRFDNQMATVFGSKTVTVSIDMLEKPDVFQTYNLTVDSENQQANGAGTKSNNLTGSNIAMLLCRDAGDNIDRLSYFSDDEVLVDGAEVALLEDITRYENMIESGGFDWFQIFIAETGVVESTLNTRNQIKSTFSGGGELEIYKFNIDWLSGSKQREFSQRVNARLAMKGR